MLLTMFDGASYFHIKMNFDSSFACQLYFFELFQKGKKLKILWGLYLFFTESF